MNQTAEGSGASFMEKVSAFIVDKRSLIFLITIILLIFSAFSRNWVEVESDLTFYLPEDSETKQALNIMEEQFTTYGTAEVMVANITYDDAEALRDQLATVLDELRRIEAGQGVNDELLDTIQMIANIMNGMQEDFAYDR